jgi:hypothetical protein
MATLTEMTLNTTVSGNSIQLPSTSGTGWSSTTSTLTLSPAATSTPAIYAATINAPSGYTFTGTGTSLSYGSNSNATYAVLVASNVGTAYLIACDGSPGSASNSLTLNLANGTNSYSLTATIQF